MSETFSVNTVLNSLSVKHLKESKFESLFNVGIISIGHELYLYLLKRVFELFSSLTFSFRSFKIVE